MGIEEETQSTFLKILSSFEELKEALMNLKNDEIYASTNVDFKKRFIDEHISSTSMHIDTLKVVLRKKNFSLRAINGISQMIGSFVRHFGDSIFETDKNELMKSLINDLMDSSRSLDKLRQDYESRP